MDWAAAQRRRARDRPADVPDAETLVPGPSSRGSVCPPTSPIRTSGANRMGATRSEAIRQITPDPDPSTDRVRLPAASPARHRRPRRDRACAADDSCATLVIEGDRGVRRIRAAQRPRRAEPALLTLGYWPSWRSPTTAITPFTRSIVGLLLFDRTPDLPFHYDWIPAFRVLTKILLLARRAGAGRTLRVHASQPGPERCSTRSRRTCTTSAWPPTCTRASDLISGTTSSTSPESPPSTSSGATRPRGPARGNGHHAAPDDARQARRRHEAPRLHDR